MFANLAKKRWRQKKIEKNVFTKQDVIIGIDLGDSRTGIAISNLHCSFASPLTTIKEKNKIMLANFINQVAKENNASKIIIGYPRNMNGTLGKACEKVKKFAKILKFLNREIEIIFFDERLTTTLAIKNMIESGTNKKNRKNRENEESARIILQSYIDSNFKTHV